MLVRNKKRRGSHIESIFDDRPPDAPFLHATLEIRVVFGILEKRKSLYS